MNISASYKYELKSSKTPVIVFLSIFAAIDAIAIVSNIIATATGTESMFRFTGQDVSIIICMFVLGIVLFLENLKMTVQNGISRRTYFISRVLSILSVSAFSSVINLAIAEIYKLFISENKSITEMLYREYYADAGYAAGLFTNLLWSFAMCVAFSLAGCFIAALIYRMPKYARFVFFGALWALMVIVIPVLENVFFDGAIIFAIKDFILFATGVGTSNPFAMVISCFVASAVFSVLLWIVMRRMPVKK